MFPQKYEAKINKGKITITKQEITTENIEENHPILKALTREKIEKNKYKPRKWVQKFYQTREKWKNTLTILQKHKLYTKPNYIPDATKKLKKWGAYKTTLYQIATTLLQRKVPKRSEKYEAAEADLNWLAAIIAEKEPKFTHICQRGNCIKNPKLPLQIHTKEMALLLGIISGDGSFYKVKDREREKLVLAIISTRKEFLNWTHSIIEKIFGKVKPSIYKVSKRKLQYRYYTTYITEAIRLAGMKLGRKPEHLEVPQWIKEKKEYIANWFKGELESDGNLKINPEKKDIQLRYTRNIVQEIKKETIKKLLNKAKILKRTNQYMINATQLPEKPPKPKIIKDEEEMIQKLTGKKPKTRIEKIFYNIKTEKITVEWVVTLYGKHAIQMIEKTKPPRIWKKHQKNKHKITWIK